MKTKILAIIFFLI